MTARVCVCVSVGPYTFRMDPVVPHPLLATYTVSVGLRDLGVLTCLENGLSLQPAPGVAAVDLPSQAEIDECVEWLVVATRRRIAGQMMQPSDAQVAFMADRRRRKLIR